MTSRLVRALHDNVPGGFGCSPTRQMTCNQARSYGRLNVMKATTLLPPVERPTPTGPVERVMSTVIRRASWSRLSDPWVAVTVSGLGLLLGMLVAATAPNTGTVNVRLPLSSFLPSLGHDNGVAMAMLYTGDV